MMIYIFSIAHIKTLCREGFIGYRIYVLRELSFEYPQFVADEVPDHGCSCREYFGDIDPELRRESEHDRDKRRESVNDDAVDAESDEAYTDELRELYSRLIFIRSLVFERPSLVHEIAVDDSDGKRDNIQDDEFRAGADAGRQHFYIENREVDSCVDDADDEEFRELFDDALEPVDFR